MLLLQWNLVCAIGSLRIPLRWHVDIFNTTDLNSSIGAWRHEALVTRLLSWFDWLLVWTLRKTDRRRTTAGLWKLTSLRGRRGNLFGSSQPHQKTKRKKETHFLSYKMPETFVSFARILDLTIFLRASQSTRTRKPGRDQWNVFIASNNPDKKPWPGWTKATI